MYCPNCQCEFDGWKFRCPQCRSALLEEPPPIVANTHQHLTYPELIEYVRSNGGEVRINLFASAVKRERKWRLPYLGYGYAWTEKLRGELDEIAVELETREEGRSREWSFPYFGYGYAWIKYMQGIVSGNQLSLTVRKVRKERKQRFPYRGYGFAWTDELEGSCGNQLNAYLQITEVSRKMGWIFPYFGYGFAWEKLGTLRLVMAADS